MPSLVKFRITLSRTVKLPPELNWMPVVLAMAVPSSTTPMILILSPGFALMVIAALTAHRRDRSPAMAFDADHR